MCRKSLVDGDSFLRCRRALSTVINNIIRVKVHIPVHISLRLQDTVLTVKSFVG
jgi:hypothetical protein